MAALSQGINKTIIRGFMRLKDVVDLMRRACEDEEQKRRRSQKKLRAR
jgi:hypothetical protein